MSPVVIVPHPHVRVSPNMFNGSPYVAGTRVPVWQIYELYKNGATVERLFSRYAHLRAAQILDALAFALDNPEVIDADIARKQELLTGAKR